MTSSGLILREDCIGDEDGGAYVWAKKNGLPESVTDRCRRGHEYVFHFVTQQRYFSALDELREPHEMKPQRRPAGRARDLTPRQGQPRQSWPAASRDEIGVDGHPLGKLPGSVWTIASAPLNVPERIEHARCCGGRKRPGCEDGLDHHAAFPPDLAKRIILGWSPSGICTQCGDGRYPVTSYTGEQGRRPGGQRRHVGRTYANLSDAALRARAIIGYACACPEPSAPAGPAVIVDPFGGTGTTALVADVLGRTGLTFDLSGGYCELAQWRTTDPAERARALGVPKPPPVPDGQMGLDFGGAA